MGSRSLSIGQHNILTPMITRGRVVNYPCREEDPEQIIMSFKNFHFSVTETQERWLWLEYNSSDMHLFKTNNRV